MGRQFFLRLRNRKKNTAKSGYFHEELFKFQTAIEAIEASLILSHKCTKNMYNPLNLKPLYFCVGPI